MCIYPKLVNYWRNVTTYIGNVFIIFKYYLQTNINVLSATKELTKSSFTKM